MSLLQNKRYIALNYSGLGHPKLDQDDQEANFGDKLLH